LNAAGQITLESGRPLLEYAPLIVEMLKPYPSMEIVLTTSWLQTLPTEKVISDLPPELARQIVGTTWDRKANSLQLHAKRLRADIITIFAYGTRLKNWMAIDDSTYARKRRVVESARWRRRATPRRPAISWFAAATTAGFAITVSRRHERAMILAKTISSRRLPRPGNRPVLDGIRLLEQSDVTFRERNPLLTLLPEVA
jgi:hypothetical protein